MKKITLTALFIIAATFLFAQNCNLIVFSEGGERFYLTLNGIQHNQTPETNVKVQALPEAGFKVKIVFEDSKITPIEKNLYTAKSTETTYSIKRKKKDNSLIIRMVSQTPIKTNETVKETAPSTTNTSNNQNSNTVTTTTQTTTTSTNNSDDTQNTNDGSSFSMNVNINETGMNVNVNDNMGGENTDVNMNVSDNTTYTESTTVTTTTTSGNTNSNTSNITTSNGRCDYPMDNSDFTDGKGSIESKTFADSKMTIAKQITKNNCPTAVQIRDYTKLFTFESGKLEYAKFAYDYCYDKGNYYKVNDAFEFESSIDELSEHTGN